MGYFERVFGFPEGAYEVTRSLLFQLCRFESGPLSRERCVFEKSGIDAGWFYTPSVAELRTEVEQAVRSFQARHPNYLQTLQTAHRHRFGKGQNDHGGRLVHLTHVVGESKTMHIEFPGALFQAASQFNLLEFVQSTVVPEDGIADYIYDATQGPACALACFPGTAYRNYLMHPRFFARTTSDTAPTVEERGQQRDHQVNMLEGVGQRLAQAHPAVPASEARNGAALPPLPAVDPGSLFTIRNGYFFANHEQKQALTERVAQLERRLQGSSTTVAAYLASVLRIGIVEDTTVTAALDSASAGGSGGGAAHTTELPKVTQTYNSALSLASTLRRAEDAGTLLLAQSVLLGTYEATLLAGVLHTLRFHDRALSAGASADEMPPPDAPPLFLTKVGGGVFNNRPAWIKDAIAQSCQSVAQYGVPLDVRLVHYRAIEPAYRDLS